MPFKKTIQLLIVIQLLIWMIFISAVTAMAENFDCSQNKLDYEVIRNIPPTHSDNGSVLYKCRICGLEYRQIIYATGHDWSDWVTEKNPTCTEPGIRKRSCNIGTPHSETEQIPSAGHNYVETVIEPNCTEAGETVYTCSVCGHSYTETFGVPDDHRYTEAVTKEPACGQKGIRTFTCAVCGDSYTEEIPALGHIYGEWIVDTPAEEGVNGSRYKECALCGDLIRETIEALPKKPLLGITEIAVAGANVTALFVFFLLLFGEFALLLWERKRKKKILAQKQFEKNGEDGYEYI